MQFQVQELPYAMDAATGGKKTEAQRRIELEPPLGTVHDLCEMKKKKKKNSSLSLQKNNLLQNQTHGTCGEENRSVGSFFHWHHW